VTSELQQDRYDKTIRRAGAIIGPGSKVSEVLTELFPMFDVENLPPELFILGGTKLSFGGGTITAIAAEFPKAQLFNPVGSGKLVTITSVIAGCNGNTTMRWGLSGVQFLPVVSSQTIRDTRSLVPEQPIAQVSQQSSGAQANATGQVNILGNVALYLTDPNGIAVLAPGTGFEIGADLVVSRLKYTFYWRERQALQSELNLP